MELVIHAFNGELIQVDCEPYRVLGRIESIILAHLPSNTEGGIGSHFNFEYEFELQNPYEYFCRAQALVLCAQAGNDADIPGEKWYPKLLFRVEEHEEFGLVFVAN